MMQLLLRMTVAPTEVGDMVDALRSVMRTARLDRGCVVAQILLDPDLPDRICYVEEWDGQREMERRIRSTAFAQLAGLMEAAIAPPALEFRTVSEVQGLEFATSVRVGGDGELARDRV